MVRKVKKISRLFLYLIPIFIIFGIGVLVTTTRHFVPELGCNVSAFAETSNPLADSGTFEGRQVKLPNYIAGNEVSNVLAETTSNSNRYIEVSLKEQKLRAWDGNQLYLETLVSTGLPWFPTPTGEFTIWAKLRYVHMVGGEGAYAYNLPNVPFVMFFQNNQVAGYRGYSLHGTYWHDDFGKVHSHGCVNLPTSIAEKLYYWVNPVLPAGQTSVFSTATNVGTKIVIHD